MKIIFSPSKEMREENIFENKKIEFTESPFKDKTNILIDILKQKSIEEIESIMKLKADLLTKTYKDIQNYDKLKYIPTVSMYYGVSFKELELEAYSEESLKYFKDEVLLNLASGEFSKLIDTKKINMINLDFKEEKDGTYKSVSTYSKKARGKFLNYLIKNQINSLEEIEKINLDGYILNKDLSNSKNLIFTRKNF